MKNIKIFLKRLKIFFWYHLEVNKNPNHPTLRLKTKSNLIKHKILIQLNSKKSIFELDENLVREFQ